MTEIKLTIKNMPVFPFPFQPYPIQEQFMQELYASLHQSKLGIFESPTGTGKSLSICCGVLQWLKDNNEAQIKDLEKNIEELKTEISSSSSNNDWLQEEYEKIKVKQQLTLLNAQLDKIKRKRDLYNEMRIRVAKQKINIQDKIRTNSSYLKKDKNNEPNENKENEDLPLEDNELILDDFENRTGDHSDEEINPEEDKDLGDEDRSIKIYISSRTHSQLSQFVGEIKRTAFCEETRVVTLASRQHFCVNSDVSKLKNVYLINERCLDMQKSSKSTMKGEEGKVLKRSKTKSCASCPYYNQTNINRLKERMLVDIMDMEDLVKCGKELKACPYYASRMALDDAEVVLISHAGIVSEGARSGISLKLTDNILILDEAHGLTAALESAHSAPLALKQLASVKTYLQFYINKYKDRLSSKNLLLLNQIAFVVSKLYGLLKPKEDNKPTEEKTLILTLEDFVIKAEIDHMNLRPLIEFSRKTRLAPKLHGFSMRYSRQDLENDMKKEPIKKSSFEQFLKSMAKKKDEVVPPVAQDEASSQATQQQQEISAGTSLYAVLDFLEMLCNRSENGRVLIQNEKNNIQLKYLLLNAVEHFSDVDKQCRSVIVAGGTMEPISEFKELLAGDSEERKEDITVLRCEHVVPTENVLGICLSKGPSNLNLNFSYESRNSKQLLDEVGRILRNVTNIVPGGVICFLPSYSYEKTVYEHIKSSGALDVICKKKQVFREPKSASEVDLVLNKFSSAVKSKEKGQTGALLFSVVGGKLSEGLNFSDDLGRCVLVVGMPYPNVKSPELQEKVKYINRKFGGTAGNIYYENLCMKAVNQCIGRAVRHANDYACVILVDERYSRTQTVAALPSFVQKSLMSNCTFGPTIGSIAKFFSRHKDKKL